MILKKELIKNNNIIFYYVMYGKSKGRTKGSKKGKSYKRSYAKGRKIYKSKKNKSTLIKLPGTIVPDRVITKIKYVDRFLITITSGAVQEYVFRGNGAYDPYHGTGGSACEGFTQWAQFFNSYRVYSSKINVRLFNTGTTPATQTFVYSLAPATTSSGFLDMQDAMAAPYSKWQLVALPSQLGNLTNYISTEKILGLNKKAVEIDITYSSLTNNYPTNEWFWLVNIEVADLDATTSAIMWVEIDYYLEFYDRTELTI